MTEQRSPDSLTVGNYIAKTQEKMPPGYKIFVKLPNGEDAPDDMTLGELRKLNGTD